MVAGSEWLSPTRMVGLIGYSASLLACGIRWVQGRQGRLRRVSGRPFAWLAAIQFVLLLDMAWDWRWKLHDFWAQKALAEGIYGERRGVQLPAVELLGGLLVIASLWIVYRFRARVGLAVALTGTLCSVGLWFCEAISYHFVDVVFYRQIGSVLSVSLLWICLAIATCFGVWLDRREDAGMLRGR